MKAILIALFFLSFNAHALYVQNLTPVGKEVSPNVSEIKIDFSEDIVPLGTKEVKGEHSSKVVVSQGLDCGLSYSGTKTIICRIKKPLAPNKEYRVTIQSGFTGVNKEERLSYEHVHSFKTSSLAVIKYSVLWNQNTPVIDLSLNYKVKEQDRSGIIQCSDRDIPVSFEPMKDKNGQADFRVKANGPLKDGEMCTFYFNRPLVYSESVGSYVPEQKVILEKTFAGVSGNKGPYEVRANCVGNYELSVDLFSGSMPYLRCEFNDRVYIGLQLSINASLDIKKFVKIIPDDGVSIEYDSSGITLSDFPYPEKSYVVKIAKGLPVADKKLANTLVVFQVETINNPPLLSAAKAVGVIEKDGPWQVAYSALNIKTLDLVYGFMNKSSDLGELADIFIPAQKQSESKTLTLNAKENENVLYPLEVKALAKEKKFKAGLFSGTMSVKDVDQKYVKAENMIFENPDFTTTRRKFQFSYLFTNIGLHVKKGRGGLLAWAFNLKEGTPLPGAEIKVYVNGAGLETMTTDEHGIAHFKDLITGKEDKFTVVAQKDDDISFINNNYGWNQGIARWDFNMGYYWQEPQDLIADIVAERPLYLPNEEVNLKLFVRKFIPDSMDLMEAGKRIKVSIFDSRTEEVQSSDVELNDYGTANIRYKLPPKAATGRYSVYIQEGKTTLTLESVFQVEEFRKPDFKVVLEESKDQVHGKITYFKGGPVKNVAGEAAILFRKESLDIKEEYERFNFPYSLRSYDYYESTSSDIRVLSREEIESDEKGEFSVNIKDAVHSVNEYGSLIVEGNFKDENGGTISGRTESLHNPYDLVPGINLTKWLYNAGETINPEAIVLNKKGEPVIDVKMKISVKQIQYFYERRLGSGNYFYYDTRKEEKVIGSCDFKSNREFHSCDMAVKDAGYFEFTIKVTDPKYTSLEAMTSTYVYSKGEFLGFEASNHDRINLNSDKSKLKLGDKLKLMAISPLQNAHALITFERDGILYKEEVKFEGNVLLYEKEITDEKLIPGFYVSVVIIKGRTSDKIEGAVDLGKPAFKIGYKRIDVENTEKRLGVKINPFKKQVQPGEMMEGEIVVTNSKGEKVKSELAIAVVDDALLSVSGPYRANYDILDTFYTMGSLGVENYQTLTQLIGRRTFGKKGANAGGGGGFEVRSDFKNTAFWAPQVETDDKGTHKFKFKVPDNLTTWKIIAVAVDKGHRFGFGENEFLASKALMVEPNLPNFLVEGDKFQAKVSVTNRSGKSQDLKVTAASSLLKITKPEVMMSVPHDDKKAAFFESTATTAGKTDFTVIAGNNEIKDGFKVSFPVLSSAIKHVHGVQGIVGEKDLNIPLVFDQEAKPESLSVTLNYSNSAIDGLDEVFKYALGYPYGCWEQRLTKAYFLVQYEAFKDSITYRFPETEGSIKNAVQKLLDLAPEYQTSSGGMRYYPGGHGEADVYLSVFTGYSFVMMKKQGYKVDPKVEADLKTYLKGLLSSDINWNNWYDREARSSTKALIVSVLSEMGEKNLNASVAKLFSEREGLDLFGLSYLAGYMSQEKMYENEAKTLVNKLGSLRVSQGGRASFKEPHERKDDLYKFWNATDNRSNCAVLQNLTKFSNDKNSVSEVVRHVIQEMDDSGHWYNTQENIYCFEALRLYVAKFEADPATGKLEVKVDAQKVNKEATTKKKLSSLVLDNGLIKKDTKNVSMKSTAGELYYSTVLRYETPYKSRDKVDQGFGLSKKIYKLDSSGAKANWLLMKDEVLRLKRGDVLKVVVDVTTSSERYQVMLNDNLAGCLEPINTQLATTSLVNEALMTTTTTKTYEWETPYYRGNGFEYLDLRLDAAQFYARKLKKGTFQVEYMVQTIATGEFLMPEATIEEMYYPDVRGTEKGRKLIVTE
jgi:uncharacterized protein YfaS (alpha-2-macroglobulin family)